MSMHFNYPARHDVFGRSPSASSAPTAYESSDCFQIVSHYHELPCMIPGPASFYHEQHAHLPNPHHHQPPHEQQQQQEEEASSSDVSLEQDKQLRIDRYFRQGASNNSAWAQCKLQYPNSSELHTGKSTTRLELLVCVICKMSFFDKHYAVASLAIESGDTIDAEITPNALFDMHWKEGTVLVLRNLALCRARLAPVTAIVTGANVVRIFTPNGQELVNLHGGNTQSTPANPPPLPLPPPPLPLPVSTSLLQPLPAASSSATSTQYQRNLHAMEQEENWEALASVLQPDPAPPQPAAAAPPPNGNDLSWLEM